MKKYRIKEVSARKLIFGAPAYAVQVRTKLGFWLTVKYFTDLDSDFARREAEELLDKLNEK
jgi:hypothetical protein|nr:MAG TPA: hypothetical protein [Caudoviricetes sp.]